MTEPVDQPLPDDGGEHPSLLFVHRLFGSAPHARTPMAPTSVARRSVLAGALAVASATLVGAPVAQAAPPVSGRILETYLAAGGPDVLGQPVEREVKRRISLVSTYGQRFERGIVWWGSGVGRVDRPGARVRLASAPNFRPVSGVSDLWRSDDPDRITALEKRIVVDLGITTMIAMNRGHDPAVPGVDRRHYAISNAGSHLRFYRGYVTRARNRAAVGWVLRRVARSHAPVLVHCQAGKDRTGWVCDLMQAVAGVDQDVRDLDYLATQAYSSDRVELAWLAAARTQLVRDYGDVSRYLVDGCGLDRADLTLLAQRLR